MSERAAQLRDTARRLLDEGTVQVVIGYGLPQAQGGSRAREYCRGGEGLR
jgi:hypothetical protein